MEFKVCNTSLNLVAVHNPSGRPGQSIQNHMDRKYIDPTLFRCLMQFVSGFVLPGYEWSPHVAVTQTYIQLELHIMSSQGTLYLKQFEGKDSVTLFNVNLLYFQTDLSHDLKIMLMKYVNTMRKFLSILSKSMIRFLDIWWNTKL